MSFFVPNFGFGYGLEVKNKFGTVIISSFTKNLHLFERLSDSSAVKTFDSPFAGGCRLFEYQTNLATSYFPSPFFTIPAQYLGQYVGITRVFEDGGRWKVELISNLNYAPELYIFTEAAGAPSYGDYGFIVRDRNGAATFDSTKAPLVVKGNFDSFNMNATAATPSSAGLDPKNGSSLGSTQMSDTFRPTNPTALQRRGGAAAKPIYQYFSTPQAQASVHLGIDEQRCLGFSPYGACIGRYEVKVWVSRYWAYYRTGINGAAGCRWITRDYGAAYVFDESESAAFLGINLGDFFGLIDGSGNYEGGKWPYENESFNLSQPPILYADATMYDQIL